MEYIKAIQSAANIQPIQYEMFICIWVYCDRGVNKEIEETALLGDMLRVSRWNLSTMPK